MRHRENLHATFLGTHLVPREPHSQHTAHPDFRGELAHSPTQKQKGARVCLPAALTAGHAETWKYTTWILDHLEIHI